MKHILILSCGAGLPDVRNKYGHAIEWIQRGVDSSEFKFTSMDVYKGKIPNYDDGDAWIITGSKYSVYDNIPWINNDVISFNSFFQGKIWFKA